MHESLKLQGELRPLRDPMLLVALRGWNDSTGTAATTLRYLREQWGATPLAELDPEPFYDFTVRRPFRRHVKGESTVRWPTGRFYVAEPEGAGRHVVLLSGREPSLRWQMFAEAVADLAGAVGASACLCIGTWGAATPHTRPSSVNLSNAAPEFEELLGLRSGTPAYQGPTGINTVLSAHLRSLGVRTGQLSALVPNYIGAMNPRAVLALVESLDRGFGTSTPTEPITINIDDFDAQAREAIEQANEPAETWDHVRELEQQYDANEELGQQPDLGAPPELPPSGELLSDLDDFLRGQRGEND